MVIRRGRPGPNAHGTGAIWNTALAHHQAGRLKEAEALYQQVLALAPNHFDAKHLLGVVALQSGRLDQAQQLISEAIRINPKFAAAHNNLGNVKLRQGLFDDAQACFQRAVQLQPNYDDANFNLANLLRKKGRLKDAALHFRRATAADGKSLNAYLNLGATLLDLGDARAAVQAFETAVRLKPDHVSALSNLGMALADEGNLQRALEMLDQALRLEPKSATVLANRGAVLARAGDHVAARKCLEQALALEPTSATAQCNFGTLLRNNGAPSEALDHFRRAIELDPDLIEAKTGSAFALRDLGDNSGAEKALREAAAAQESNAEFHYHLGNMLMLRLSAAEAVESYQRALAADATHVQARWALTMGQIPPIYADADHVAKARSNFDRMLGELNRWFDGARVAEGHKAVGSTTPFYLAYQASNNRELLARYGALCTRLMAPLQSRLVPAAKPRAPSGPIRVGIASAHLHDHSVWNALIKGYVRHFDKQRFDLHLFNLGARNDAETEQGRQWAHRLESGSRDLSQWAAVIANSELDVLIYPEVGMDTLTARLASMRLAPVQAASWGHPESTGLPTIDYYLSAEALEPAGAQRHYTERLVALPHLGVCYEPLDAAAVAPNLAALGLPQNVPLLLCPGTPFKYSPLYDHVWVEISRRAAPSRIVFFRPKTSDLNRQFEQRLERRYAAAGLNIADCVSFIPFLNRENFYGLMQRSQLFLDTLGFSGFNTVMQAVECGLPVVTREGEFMRGRLGSGILRQMGMDALVAASDEAYIDLAVALARDDLRRTQLREQLIARRGVLFGDREPVRALETFIEKVARPDARAKPA